MCCEIKFVVCLASYSLGNATDSCDLSWLGKNNWVHEFGEAELFSDELEAKTALEAEEVHGIDPRSLSIIKVLYSDYRD